MNHSAQPARVVRFGIFEADLVAGELRKRGRKVELQDQPFHVLALLLQRPKQVVTREELRQALWPADTFVEFDESLNKAVQKLRQALGDSADKPHFIETIPRKGYRFIASIEKDDGDKNGRDGKRHWLLAAVGLVTIVAACAVWFWNKSGNAPEAELVPFPLTSDPGEESSPSFSPDGSQVAYQWCPEPRTNCDIYIKQIGVDSPFRLTNNPDSESPAWSPDGQTIAFLRIFSPAKMALILIPQRGGREKVLAEFEASEVSTRPAGPHLEWTPDSKWLVAAGFEGSRSVWSLFLVSVATGEKRKLTTPPSTGVAGDSAPTLSPDGRSLVFARESSVLTSDLYVLRLADGYMPRGEPERIGLENVWNSDPAWTRDGSEIVFTSGTILKNSLSRTVVSKSARPRRLPFPAEEAFSPAVSRAGHRLAYAAFRFDTNIWSVTLNGSGRRQRDPGRLISSTRFDWDPAYSLDGKKLAFLSDRSGTAEIWISDSDGSNAEQLTSFGGPILEAPRWSPDSHSIAVTVTVAGSGDIFVIRTKGGAPRRLTTHPAVDKSPYWSRDGQWLYFCSTRSGEPGEIWKISASGGDAVQITRNGGDVPQESTDGRWLYYSKGSPIPLSIWKVPVEGGEETKVLDSVYPGLWSVTQKGIYIVKIDEHNHSDLSFHDLASVTTRKILRLQRPPISPGIAVSPGGRTILYSQFDEAGSDLMLVENFR